MKPLSVFFFFRWCLSSLIYPTQLTVHSKLRVLSFSPTGEGAYHLQKVSGKSDWKVKGKRLLGSFRRKIFGNGTPEKVVLFFQTECFTEILVPFLQSHLWYQFNAFAAVFRWMELICANGKRDSGTKFTKSPIWILLTTFPNRERTGLPYGKQPKFSCSMAA